MLLDWTSFKNLCTAKKLNMQYDEIASGYDLFFYDDQHKVKCYLSKYPSDTTDLDDFENNYKSNCNKRISNPKDTDGSSLQRTKITNTGWNYQLKGLEFTTSDLDSTYSKDADDNDLGDISIKLYDSNGDEITTELDEPNCVKTVVDWEPSYDYELIGGMFKVKQLIVSDVRLWIIGVPDVPAQYGGNKLFASGVNLQFVGLEEGVRADGRASKLLLYDPVYHTNKLRLILKHSAGYQVSMHMLLELFKG